MKLIAFLQKNVDVQVEIVSLFVKNQCHCLENMVINQKQVFFHYQDGSLVDHRAYKPYTLVGPPALRLVLDPLTVIFLDNRLYMSLDSHMKLGYFLYTVCFTFNTLEKISLSTEAGEAQVDQDGRRQ